MTDFDRFERRLAGALRSDADASVGPFEAGSIADAAIAGAQSSARRLPRASTRPARRFGRGRGMTLLAAAALFLVGGALAGSGILGLPPVVPPLPSPSFGLVVPTSPDATFPRPSVPSAAPTASPVTDPAGVWIFTGTMGMPRFEHAAVRLLDGRVLVVGCCGGGSDASAEVTTSAELYDPNNGTWTATGSLANRLRANVLGTATLLSDGRVLVLVAGDADDEVGAEVYDPASGTWTATGQMVSGANYVGDTATVLADGRVLVAGLNGVQLYDPDSGTWTATGKMTIPRYYATATLLPDGKVLSVGGFVVPDRQTDVAELYDPNSGSWTAIANPLGGHRDTTATLLRDGNVLVAGRGDRGTVEFEVYVAATGTWTEVADGPGFLFETETLLSDGTVLVAGWSQPADDSEPLCTTAALYDPRTGSWTTAQGMPRCGNGSTFTLLLDGTVLVAGGSDCDNDVCVSTAAAELYVPAGVSPPPFAFPPPPPPVIPTPTPVPTPFPPAAGPVPPNARSWTVTVDNQSSKPVTLSVAAADGTGPLQLVGSATPNVVPAGATVNVTFLFPVNGGRADGWICMDLRPGDEAGLVEAADIGMPGKIRIPAEGEGGWVSP